MIAAALKIYHMTSNALAYYTSDHEIRETFTSHWNLTLPGPMYNQPSHEMKWESKPIIYFYYLSSKRLKELYKQKFWFTFHLIALWSKVVFSVVPSYGVVPGEAQF